MLTPVAEVKSVRQRLLSVTQRFVRVAGRGTAAVTRPAATVSAARAPGAAGTINATNR